MKADKAEVSRKIKIARGQLDGILRMIEEDRYCVDISYQLVATQSLLKRANQDILQAHIRHCVREALDRRGAEAARAYGAVASPAEGRRRADPRSFTGRRALYAAGVLFSFSLQISC